MRMGASGERRWQARAGVRVIAAATDARRERSKGNTPRTRESSHVSRTQWCGSRGVKSILITPARVCDLRGMPHWWTPCIEAYPIRMPDRRPAKVKSLDRSSTAEPEFPKATPLKEVVANCEQRWFEQTLKAAKSGDISSQCLVGQMFCSGYGVPANVKKGKFWLQKAAELDMEARSLLASLSVGRSVESYMEEPEAV